MNVGHCGGSLCDKAGLHLIINLHEGHERRDGGGVYSNMIDKKLFDYYYSELLKWQERDSRENAVLTIGHTCSFYVIYIRHSNATTNTYDHRGVENRASVRSAVLSHSFTDVLQGEFPYFKSTIRWWRYVLQIMIFSILHAIQPFLNIPPNQVTRAALHGKLKVGFSPKSFVPIHSGPVWGQSCHMLKKYGPELRLLIL